MNADMSFFEKRHINKNVPIPLYYQLKEILLEYTKLYDVGTFLPTEKQLSERYEISRPTVHQAIRELQIGGNVIQVKGKGTYIAEPKIDQEFRVDFEGFEETIKRIGFKMKAKILELKVSNCVKGCQVLKLPIETNLYTLRRIIYANETPMVLSLSHFPCNLFPEFDKKDFTKKSISDIITNDYGYKIQKVTKTIEAKTISDYESKLLNVERESPVQYIETVCCLEDNTPIEFTMERYRADKSRFTFVLNSVNP